MGMVAGSDDEVVSSEFQLGEYCLRPARGIDGWEEEVRESGADVKGHSTAFGVPWVADCVEARYPNS